jgi:hypothetical protein
MVEIISNRRAWVIALILVTMFVGCVATEQFGMFEVSVDNPLGTLRFDELSVALATDPDREVERIVGHVWRFEGPKRLITRGSALYFPAVDLGIDDSFEYQLYLDFATPRDGSRFKTEEVAIACFITSANFGPVETTSPHDRRSISAKSCRVVESDSSPASDSP